MGDTSPDNRDRDAVWRELEGPRPCGPYDLAGVLDNANLVMRVRAPEPKLPTIGHDWANVYNPGNLDNIRVISHRGVIVSSVAIFPSVVHTPAAKSRSAASTPSPPIPTTDEWDSGPPYSRTLTRKCGPDGYHIGLLATAVHDYYRKFDWETGGRQRHFTFDRGNIPLLPDPPGNGVSEEWIPHREQMRSLRELEPLAAHRSDELFPLLLERRSTRVFVTLADQEVTAYVAVRGSSVVEYAGPTQQVAALIHHAFETLDDPDQSTTTRSTPHRPTLEMSVITPDQNTGLPAFFTGIGIPSSLDYIGMFKIMNPQPLFAALRIGDVTLDNTGHTWSLHHSGQTLTVSSRELVKLIFGPERHQDFAPDLFPIDFYQWPLDMV